MIQAIIFDCFGVLFRGDLEHMHELTPPERHSELKDLYHSADLGYIDVAHYIAGLAELTGTSEVAIRQIMDEDHVRNDPLFDYIRELKRSYSIGVLSNAGIGVVPRLLGKDIELFDAVVASSDIGMQKPSPEIYQHICGVLGVTPESALMVDDLESNVTGARQAGMRGIQYRTLEQLRQDIRQLEAAHA